jgi:hypothetical protein
MNQKLRQFIAVDVCSIFAKAVQKMQHYILPQGLDVRQAIQRPR